MKPEDVICPKSKIKEVNALYYDKTNDFSIASLTWNGENRIGIRWNGGDKGLGYPQTRGKATWFILPKAVALAFAISIGDDKLTQVVQASVTKPLS